MTGPAFSPVSNFALNEDLAPRRLLGDKILQLNR